MVPVEVGLRFSLYPRDGCSGRTRYEESRDGVRARPSAQVSAAPRQVSWRSGGDPGKASSRCDRIFGEIVQPALDREDTGFPSYGIWTRPVKHPSGDAFWWKKTA